MTSDEQFNRERELFARALEFPAGAERERFLKHACGDDAALRDRVAGLLRVHEGAQEFLPKQSAATIEVVIPVEKPGDRIGRYKILQQIGEGGCGVVYMAEQEEPVRRRIALKVIKLGMDTKSVIARFEAERQALALMDHPNIAKVFDAGATDTGRPYFVMELVKGVRITEYCDQNNLSTADRLSLFTKVCSAIQHAHQKGIIHRDIKPSNILVTLHDGVPVPKVIDFGIAKATDQRLTDKTLFTAFEQFIGTPAYMSPEQAEMSGLDIDTRTDIYSLGVLLYELLTGKTPFDAKELLAAGLDEMRRTIREQEPVRPSTRLSTLLDAERTTVAKRRQIEFSKLAALVRGDLDWIVMKALEKDRTRRYDTATSFAQDITRHLNNEPVLARPPSTLYRMRKAARRNRLAFAAAAMVAAALLVGLGTSTLMFVRERAARKSAAKAEQEQTALRKLADASAEETGELLYVADMGAAFRALEDSNLGRVHELLQRYVPKPGEKDRRGFEWRHLAFRVRDQSRLVLEHPEGVFGATFTRDGRSAVTVARDDKLRVWDLATKRVVRTMDRVGSGYGSDKPIFSPDGRWLAVSRDGKTAVFDTSAPDWPVVYAGSNDTAGFQFSGDGTQFLDVTVSNTWETVNSRNWTLTSVQHRPEEAPWLPLASEPSRASFITWGTESHERAELVRFDTKEPAFASTYSNISYTMMYAGHPGALAWSARGVMAAGTRDGRLFAWNVGEDKFLFQTNAHSQGIYAMAFDPSGEVLATCSHDQKIILWAMPSGQRLATLLGHQRMVLTVVFSADGQSLITGSSDKTVRVWDVSDVPTQPALFDLPDGQRFTADSRHVVSLTRENLRESVEKSPWMITREDVKRPGRIERLPWPDAASDALTHPAADSPETHEHTGVTFYAGTLSPDARVIGRIVNKSTIELFDLAARSWNRRHDFGQDLRTFQFSPAGETIAVITKNGRVEFWDWKTDQTRVLPAELTGDAKGMSFAPGGRALFVGDGQLRRIIDLDRMSYFAVERHPFETISFSADGRFITAPDLKQHSVRVLELPSGREVCSIVRQETGLTEPEPMYSAVSSGGDLVAISDTQSTVTLWNTRTGRQVGAPMKGHLGAMSGLKFSPDNRLLVSASWDETARLWHVATQRELASFKDCGDPRFSPDGRTLMLGGRAGRILLHAPSLEEISATR